MYLYFVRRVVEALWSNWAWWICPCWAPNGQWVNGETLPLGGVGFGGAGEGLRGRGREGGTLSGAHGSEHTLIIESV